MRCIVATNCDKPDSKKVDQTCSDIGNTCDPTADPMGCATGDSCATAPAEWNNMCVPTKACTEKVDGIQATCASTKPKCDSTKADSGCATGE